MVEHPPGRTGMTAPALSAPSSERFAHQLLVYDSFDELADAAVPFLREGARDGDAMLMVAAPDKLEAVRAGLSPEEDHSVSFASSWDCYARPGVALNEFQRFIQEHRSEGRKVRALGEPPRESVSRPYRRELACIDAAFNTVAHAPGASIVCPLDRAETPPDVLDALRRSHPEVVEAGHRRPSPDFTDATALLLDTLRQPLPAPAGEIDELIPGEPATARSFVDAYVAPMLDVERRNDFVTAVNEVVANAFTHAEMDRLRLWQEDDHVVCEVRDEGGGLSDPLVGYRSPTLEQTSGWGLWLARQLAGVVEVHSDPGGSVVRLHAPLAPAGADG